MKPIWKSTICGAAAGAANGLFGAGGGMVLLPLMDSMKLTGERQRFATALGVMLPVSLVSFLRLYLAGQSMPQSPWLYCLGGLIGGALGAFWYQRIPLVWLRRALGAIILWGGLRQWI